MAKAHLVCCIQAIDTAERLSRVEVEEAATGIDSRARMISRKFPNISYDDMCQDAMLCLIGVLKKEANSYFLFYMKAVNRLFGAFLKGACRAQRSTAEVTTEIEETTSDGTNEDRLIHALDREIGIQKTSPHNRVLLRLLEAGYRPVQIAKITGLSSAVVYSKIRCFES